MKLPIGQRLGTYSVSGFLGEGGTSEVYLVCKGAQSFALKILKEEHRTSEALQARLINEAITLQKLDIAGVVRVFDEGDFVGRPFYVMEYLPTSLSARLIGLLPPAEIVPVITSLLRTLSELHQRGYVHRDVKPSNILFAADGTVRIADFGHAKLPEEESCVIPHSTETGAFLGTREYAAPEQLLNAKTVDGRADVYALGLILYEALAGRRPFMKQKPEELARLRQTQRAPRLAAVRPDISPQLVELVAQMLERTPERRPCADQLLKRLETVPLALTARFSAIRLAALLALPVFLSGPSLVDSSAVISVTTPSPILLAPRHAPERHRHCEYSTACAATTRSCCAAAVTVASVTVARPAALCCARLRCEVRDRSTNRGQRDEPCMLLVSAPIGLDAARLRSPARAAP